MGDSFITIIAIVLAAVLMFVFPLIAMAERSDDISQLTVETAVTEFVDNVRTTGRLTYSDYDSLVQTLAATGNAYDIEMEAQILDENPGKKTTTTNSTKIGENVYYSIYTSQLLETLNGGTAVYAFKEGDIFSTSVSNSNTTIAQQLSNFFYTVVGYDTSTIAAEHAGYVTANGSN